MTKPAAKAISHNPDVLILHGMSKDLVEDIKAFLGSLGLTAATVLDRPSTGKAQNERVTSQIKSCGLPLVLLTFDEQEKNTTKARPNVYEEMARCQLLRPKDTLVVRETRGSKRVDLPSNLEGKLIILEFETGKVQKLYPQLIIELKGRDLIQSQKPDELGKKLTSAGILNSFLDRMDDIWESEFDVASENIDRRDWPTENKFADTLDKFFLEYWKVFNALIRENKQGEELQQISDRGIAKAYAFAAEVWERIADAKMTAVEELREKRIRDKKFDGHTFDKYFKMADQEIREAKKKHATSEKKIEKFRSAVDTLRTLVNKIQ